MNASRKRGTVLSLASAEATLAGPRIGESRRTSAQSSTRCTPSFLVPNSAGSRVPVDLVKGCSDFDRRNSRGSETDERASWATVDELR